MISFEALAPGTKAVLEALGATDKEIPKILSAALNKTAPALRTAGVRMVTRDYNVKQGEVRKRISIKKASPVYLVARLEGSGASSIPLVQFRVGGRRVPSTFWRGTKGSKKVAPARGVSVKVRKAGGNKTITGGFVARMPSGHIGLFVRSNRINKKGRQTIEEKYGPSAITLLSGEQYKPALDLKAGELMEQEVPRAATRFLERLR